VKKQQQQQSPFLGHILITQEKIKSAVFPGFDDWDLSENGASLEKKAKK